MRKGAGYDVISENGSTNIDLNLQASSNMISFNRQQPLFPSGFGSFQNVIQGSSSLGTNNMNFNSPLKPGMSITSYIGESNDVLVLKEKIAELTQALASEVEAVRVDYFLAWYLSMFSCSKANARNTPFRSTSLQKKSTVILQIKLNFV